MEQQRNVQQQHHVEDVGRILLQTQDQLKQLREQLVAQSNRRHSFVGDGELSSSASNSNNSNNNNNNHATAEMEEILRRAENELRLKAEIVLNNLVAASPASPTRLNGGGSGGGDAFDPLGFSLPSVHKSYVGGGGGGGSPLGRRRRHRQHHESEDDQLDLDYFRQRFKSNTVETLLLQGQSPTSGPSSRRGGGLSAVHRHGKLAKHKTAGNARLLPFVNKYDPVAPRPLLSPADATQGVLSLLNRGFLPANVDLTPAFQSPPADGRDDDDNGDSDVRGTTQHSVIKNNAVKLYRRQELPVRAVPYSNPTNFNLATLKFDMATFSVAISKDREQEHNTSSSSPQRSLNTVSISFPHVSSGDKSPTNSGSRRSNQDANSGEGAGAGGGGEGGTDGAPRYEDEAPGNDDGDEVGADERAEESDANSMEDLRHNVDKIRGYNELLDTYSLHQFIIHKGRAMRETPEFQSFKRVGQEIWGSVDQVIRALETLLTTYFVPLAYIDGQRLLGVASMEMASTALSTRELLSCIVNEDQVASLLRRPGQRYKGKDRKKRAATTLQAFFRMLTLRNTFRKLRCNGSSAMRIQTAWRAYACQQRLREQLTQRRTTQLRDWQAQMTRLRAQWREIRTQRRVVVHVPSISVDERARLGVDNLAVLQNLQLSRLAAIVDPQVEMIVYVAPFELSHDVQQYFLKLLALAGIEQAAQRVKIVFPEHAAQFPSHFSLATHLLYSPHCLQRIRRLVKSKEAYLVMGVPGAEDQRLALALQLPLLGLADPLAANALLTKSGCKRLFIKADVNVPVGTYDLYDVDELQFALAKLIISHLDQNVWLLRLDNDPFHTGTALLDVTTLTTLREIRREKKAPEYWRQPGIRDTVARALLQELEREMPRLARPSHTEIYATWREFALAIATQGVVVEAMPDNVVGVVRANLFVEPSGDVHVASTQELLAMAMAMAGSGSGSAGSMASRRRAVAFAFPQTLVPYEAVVGASQAVGKLLHADHAFCGYVSVDLQLFRESTSGSMAGSTTTTTERLWAVALHPYLTNSAASFATFHALHRGSVDPHTGLYHLPASTTTPGSIANTTPTALAMGAPRSFVVVDFVLHPNVSTMPYSAFFHTCRLHGVCFDVARCVGSLFLLADSLTAGVFGVLSSGETHTQALQYLRTAFEVIGREVGTQSLRSLHSLSSGVGSSDAAATSTGNFAEVLSVLRQRLGVEKDKDKEARRSELAKVEGQATGLGLPATSSSGTSTSTSTSTTSSTTTTSSPAAVAAVASGPKLRVGKVDSLRRMRRMSQ